MDPKLQDQLDEQEVKINDILKSVRKTENYMKWTFWTTIIVFVLPLLLMAIAIPKIISTYTITLQGFM